MFQIDLLSRTPVYEQIVEQAERFILSGVLKPGDQLPSVRTLSERLSVNPNTIQKAYAELERRGLTVPAAGRGCFVRGSVDEAVRRFREKKLEELRELALQLKNSGLEKAALTALIDDLYEKGGGDRS